MEKKTKSFVAPYLEEMMHGVHPSWRRILLSTELKPIFQRCIKQLETSLMARGVTFDLVEQYGLATYIRPRPADIFRAFRYFDVNNLRSIIIGQDPYPKPTDAMGLSFSVPETVKMPPSLRNMFIALQNSGLLADMPKTGRLESWAAQGVLLLNRWLTRMPNIERHGDAISVNGNGDSGAACTHSFWAEYTDALCAYLVREWPTLLNHEPHPVTVMLWGNPAQEIASVFADTTYFRVLRWGHPSPLNRANAPGNPQSFVNCDHFLKLSETKTIFPPIVWDPAAPVGTMFKSQFWYRRAHDAPTGTLDLSDWLTTANIRRVYSDGTDNAEDQVVRAWLAEQRRLLPPGGAKKEAAPAPQTAPQTDKPKHVEPIYVFADGGCEGNGRSDAVASYGCYIPASWLGAATRIYGTVPRFELTRDAVSGQITPTTRACTPTNNRGEMLAVIYALDFLLREFRRHGTIGPIRLVLDSGYVMHAMNERLWRHQAKNNFASISLNLDLIRILFAQQNELAALYDRTATTPDRAWHVLMQPAAHNHYASKEPMRLDWPALTILHQYSHLTTGEKKAAIARGGGLHIEGNEEVDRLCTVAKNGRLPHTFEQE